MIESEQNEIETEGFAGHDCSTGPSLSRSALPLVNRGYTLSNSGWLLSYANYWDPLWFHDLQSKGIDLVVPGELPVLRLHRWPHWLPRARRRIEIDIG